MFWGDLISAGEEFPPPSNSLFDFWGGDTWPQRCVQNSGMMKERMELWSFDWILDKDSQVHERIKAKGCFYSGSN